MFKATCEIYEALKKADGLKVFTDENEGSSSAWVQFSVKNGGCYRIRFISDDNGNDVEVRVYALTQITEDRMPRMLRLINRLNCEYRFLKFYIDEDGDLDIAYDYPVYGENPASSACEMVVRFISIIDDVYPRIMRALWAE